MAEKRYRSLQEFYPFYLSEHQNPTSRVLHFIGTGLVLLLLPAALLFHNGWLLLLIPFVGYGFAWVGHFFFEKNKPATFQYPGYSLASDFKLFFDLLQGKESFHPKKRSHVMEDAHTYQTMVDALADLKAQGFTHDFNLKNNCLKSNEGIELDPHEFEIVRVVRFEGMTDPADNTVLYAIESADGQTKGTFINAYGVYSETISEDLLRKLQAPH